MTKHERAKMMKRLHMSIPWLASGHPEDQKTVLEACVLEVDRAVRAERKAQLLADEAENRRKDALARMVGIQWTVKP